MTVFMAMLRAQQETTGRPLVVVLSPGCPPANTRILPWGFWFNWSRVGPGTLKTLPRLTQEILMCRPDLQPLI